MPSLIAASMPRTQSRHRGPYPYSPEFLSHFPALVVRAAQHTLDVPEHPAYVLDTRMAQHARVEVLLRRLQGKIRLVVAAGRFPHGVERLRPVLPSLVVDVRRWPGDEASVNRRLKSYLLCKPAMNGTPHASNAALLADPALAGWWVPAEDILDRSYFKHVWLPALYAVPRHIVVLDLPHRGADAAIEALACLQPS